MLLMLLMLLDMLDMLDILLTLLMLLLLLLILALSWKYLHLQFSFTLFINDETMGLWVDDPDASMATAGAAGAAGIFLPLFKEKLQLCNLLVDRTLLS